MSATFEINTISDLNNDFLERLKAMFNGQNMMVTVESEHDETEYLLSNANNRAFLMNSIRQAEEGKIVKVLLEDL